MLILQAFRVTIGNHRMCIKNANLYMKYMKTLEY